MHLRVTIEPDSIMSDNDLDTVVKCEIFKMLRCKFLSTKRLGVG